MFNLGTGEVFVILLVALIVLGPDKLPQAARKIGQTVGELRRISSGFQSELRDAMQEPMQEPILRGPTAGSFERSDGMPLKSGSEQSSGSGAVEEASTSGEPGDPGAPATDEDPSGGDDVTT